MPELWQAHLTFALLAFAVIPTLGSSPAMQFVRLLVLLGISFIPVEGLSLAAYMRSFTDDVAITSLVALTFVAAVRMGLVKQLDRTIRLQVLVLIAALALFLYPATMGLSYFDPYRLGYNPRPLILIIGLLALGLLMLRNWLGACMLGFATLAFSLGLKPSPNYWDYLLDPFIALYCWGALLGYAIKLVVRRSNAPRELKLPIRP
ncbi:hypothetical protein DP090_024715 [Pseudomonas sp. MDMC216]|jgi:hypothetical protein|uniref:Uncharacterized protein n=1 Tax=Ectopseudomonas toyotomiensis TaxID=554344 RepID=A0A1I5U643_9GAMM|nr:MULTISPECIES: hypothetical protein [Pseudomonas]PKM28479.1 MAG: hypothetical protein CVV07_14050 [Gammaproteobacteria bacterium HGW-Gammaproteobacteria-11]MBA4681182.1 hypothetical protein [Pseudomonas sp.]MDI5996223.1 hypothetical protein [Pseudomonas sp. MDMC216]MDI6008753.1 hypothetical protein [Pseudomonas sp. MDMC17]MPT21333.1 hypothetical protein [Pseudomonas sp.]